MKKQQNCYYGIFYHIILTVKYRKKIIVQYDSDIKSIIEQLFQTVEF